MEARGRWTARVLAMLVLLGAAWFPELARAEEAASGGKAERVASAAWQAPVERRAPQDLGGDPVPTIRVESRLVTVAVNVEDAKGIPVAGLTRGDFQILEDGKPQTTAVFEKESSTPLSIVVAIDSSETVLTNAGLERAAAKRFVRALLRDQDELDLMDFSDTVREIVPFTNQKKRIEAGLGELKRGDETALYDAVYLGSQRLGETKTDAGRRRVLVVISDGGDSKSRSTYMRAVEEAQRAGAAVYAIVVVPIEADAGRNTGGEHALMQMAEDTGGKFYYARDAGDLDAAFTRLSDDLRTQYVLGYYAPAGRPLESAYRKITVRLSGTAGGSGDRLRYRTGYYADAR